jgi:hypothetical protein
MPIVNHNQSISIWRMVLDRLPFVINDSNNIFNFPITAVSVDTLTIAGNQTAYIRPNAVHTVSTNSYTVMSSAYSSGSNSTTITYFLLSPAPSVGNTLHVEANFNEQQVSRYILEMMYVLQPCFQIDPATDIGDESKYNMLQRLVIAELVCYYIVLLQSSANVQGAAGTQSGAAPQKYVQSSSANGVSVTWAYLSLNNAPYLALNAEKLMNQFKYQAACFGKQLGCQIEICADGGISCSCNAECSPTILHPFIVADKLNCDC